MSDRCNPPRIPTNHHYDGRVPEATTFHEQHPLVLWTSSGRHSIAPQAAWTRANVGARNERHVGSADQRTTPAGEARIARAGEQ